MNTVRIAIIFFGVAFLIVVYGSYNKITEFVAGDVPLVEKTSRKVEEKKREDQRKPAAEKERTKKEKEKMKTAGLIQDMSKASSKKTSSDGRYSDNGDGTITDSKTGLMWTKKDSYADLGKCLDWNDSNSYVSSLTAGRYNDWRMPAINELKIIFEKSKNNKNYKGGTIHSDPIFASGGAYWYWSSETAGSSRARVVGFFNGFVVEGNRDLCTLSGVRAVRR